MFYLINFLFIYVYYTFISLLDKSKSHKKKYIFFIMVCLHAVLFRALANPFNYVDTNLYASGFDMIKIMSFNEAILSINIYTTWGLGYVFINWLIGQFCDNFQVLYAIISFLSVTPIIYFYYKTSYKFLFSITFYLIYPMLYIMGFGVLRQHLSIAFIMLAILNMDNYKRSIPLIFISVLCHTSSLVIVPFFFMRKFNISKYNPIKLLGFVILGVTVSRLILISFVYNMRYYGDVAKGESENNIVPTLLIGSLILVLYITGCLKKEMCNQDRYILNFLFYGFAIALFSMGQAGGGRLTLAFIYVLPVGISFLFKYLKNHSIPIIYTLMVFILIGILYYMSGFDYYKYSFFWEPTV